MKRIISSIDLEIYNHIKTNGVSNIGSDEIDTPDLSSVNISFIGGKNLSLIGWRPNENSIRRYIKSILGTPNIKLRVMLIKGTGIKQMSDIG